VDHASGMCPKGKEMTNTNHIDPAVSSGTSPTEVAPDFIYEAISPSFCFAPSLPPHSLGLKNTCLMIDPHLEMRQ